MFSPRSRRKMPAVRRQLGGSDTQHILCRFLNKMLSSAVELCNVRSRRVSFTPSTSRAVPFYGLSETLTTNDLGNVHSNRTSGDEYSINPDPSRIRSQRPSCSSLVLMYERRGFLQDKAISNASTSDRELLNIENQVIVSKWTAVRLDSVEHSAMLRQ